jgi:chromosome segregation ATPase
MEAWLQVNGPLPEPTTAETLKGFVAAKKGIRAYRIGNDASKPCTLVLGLDLGVNSVAKRFVNKLTKEMSAKEEEQRTIVSRREPLRQKSSLLSREIGHLVQIQDRGGIEQRQLTKVAEKLGIQKNLPALAKVELDLKTVEARIRESEEPLTRLMDQETEITDKISELDEASQRLGREIKALDQQMQSFLKDADPFVRAGDVITSGNHVMGEHASIVLKENYRTVQIRPSSQGWIKRGVLPPNGR